MFFMKIALPAVGNVFPPILLLLALFLAAPPAHSQAGSEVLTNDSVISMAKAGITTNVIVTKIRTSKSRFNLTTNELIRLKESGINEEILMAMQGYSESSEPPTAENRGRSVASNDQNDPMTPHDIGVYLYTEKSGEKKLTELESNAVTGGRTAGMAGTKLTYGIWMSKEKVKIPGSSANLIVKDPQPVFYFYLNPKDRTMTTIKYFPASVNQFQMVKFDVKGKSREVAVGKSNSYYSKTGIPDDNLVEFSYEKVGDGIFKVTPKQVLKSGEYGFYLLGTGNSVGATFFDFSVRPVP